MRNLKINYCYYSRKSLFELPFSIVCKIANKIVMKMPLINFYLIKKKSKQVE